MTATESTTIPHLVKDLRAQALTLEKDLRVRSREVPDTATRLKGEYDAARAAERTAMGYTEWVDGRVTQAAAAWVLSTVFVRYCEDNGLIETPFLAGPGERLIDAEEHHDQFITANPTLNNRDWLVAAFDHISAAHPTAAGLFERTHNPLWDITISYEAANDLIAFWRRRDDSGALRYDFTSWDTRFLGDLYQDLSEDARKQYALLQTPEFVEEFILDLTLEPAVEEFGLEGLRTIDPASGSGHFLLGLFRRILGKWRTQEPGTDDWELIRRSLASVHGCDKNPFATSIARFRLLVAALEEAGEKRLDRAQEFPINVAVGDSLLHGRGAPGLQAELFDTAGGFEYRTEDVSAYVPHCDLLGRGTYHVVVGNPPYVSVDDRREKQAYRTGYASCLGKFVLSVPFMERFFQLAIPGRSQRSDRGGYVGQITSNSFTKREFGKKLVLDVLPRLDITHVLDTSGAYIPHHGTPTVIVIGRNELARPGATVRVVRGIRGEPSVPELAASGQVWRGIVTGLQDPASTGRWVATSELARERFLTRFPWILTDGGLELVESMEVAGPTLASRCERIGFYGIMGADDALSASSGAFSRAGAEPEFTLPLLVGENVRDWRVVNGEFAFRSTGDDRRTISTDRAPRHLRRIWHTRTALGNRATFSGSTYFLEGRPWYEWHQLPRDLDAHEWAIVFAEVVSHNHFALDRQGSCCRQTAPIIRLPKTATAADFLGIVGLLNSSAACFWLKQFCYPKGGDPIGDEGARVSSEAWFDRIQFNSRNVGRVPVPRSLPVELADRLDRAASRVLETEPDAVLARTSPSRSALDVARAERARILQTMISLQEELDWSVYASYGLISEGDLRTVRSDPPERLAAGERAFEIVLARRQSAGEVETLWFDRNGSAPIVDLPKHWPPAYRAVVERRIELIETRHDLALIESPDHKRRWQFSEWEAMEEEALRTWLLDRCETPGLWFGLRDGIRQPRTLTVSRLADKFAVDDTIHSAAALYAESHLGRRDMTLAQVLEQVVGHEHVPYLAAVRHRSTGLGKRAEWERTWEGQREEDRHGRLSYLPAPPPYKDTDFTEKSYWRQRGKLDIPGERFISYPGAGPDADPTLLLGWAGWDHKDQAQALVNLVNDRSGQAGWDTGKITPLLAGLAEVMPWVHQWHGDYDPEWEGTPAEEYQAFLDQQRTDRGLTEDDLRDWRPAVPTRGRRPKGTT